MNVRQRARIVILDAQIRGLAAWKRVRRAVLTVYVRLLLVYRRWLRWRLRRIERKRLVRESREFVRGELGGDDP